MLIQKVNGFCMDCHLDEGEKQRDWFRCGTPTCGSNVFGCYACLLLHERNIHGKHGGKRNDGLCAYDTLYELCSRVISRSGEDDENLHDHFLSRHWCCHHDPYCMYDSSGVRPRTLGFFRMGRGQWRKSLIDQAC